MKKMVKMVCLLTFMGFLTLGLSGIASADAPAADFRPAKVQKAGKKGINYPAYLYARGQRCERIYKQYVKPARGYDFTLYPLASRHYVPAPW